MTARGAVQVITLEGDGGWVAGARRAPSANCDDRPAGTVVDLLVVHGISLPEGCYGGPHVEDLFCNRLDVAAHPDFAGIAGLRVAAHVLVRRDGDLLQFCSFHRRAWHAGRSAFDGRPECNDYSVGVELEGCDADVYTPAQYAVLAGLARALMRAYPGITPERVVGHCDVAPGRKTDPGPGFDWKRLRASLGPVDQA